MVANRWIDHKLTVAKRFRVSRVGIVLILILSACSPQNFFFYPNRVLYNDPDRFPIAHEVVSYASINGKTLYAVYFKTDQTPIGTVVHFHGNFGNVSNHFPLVLFLTKFGFDVLSFDYEGYGASEGHPSIKNMIDDGRASVAYATHHSRAPGAGVVLLGQSLGGAAAIVVAAQEKSVRAIVAEAPFAGYRTMARTVVGRHILTWPLYPFVPLIGSTYDPIRFVASISPRPIYFIHGDADTVVPVDMSKKLYDAAQKPKMLWIVPGADHIGAHRAEKTKYETSVVDFFTRALR